MEEQHVCHHCGRRFDSGRALGGHMRSHVSSGRSSQVVPTSPRPSPDEDSDSDYSVTPTVNRRRRRPSADGAGSSNIMSASDAARCLMMLSRDVPEAGGRRWPNEYPCPTCDKAFGSYQALGGHRAGHKKLGMNCGTRLVESTGHVTKKLCIDVEPPPSPSPESSGGGPGGSPSTTEEEEKGGEGGCFIDLNLPPPEDEDEDEDANF